MHFTERRDIEKAFIGILLTTAGFFVYYYEHVIYERYFDQSQHIAIDTPQQTAPSGFLIPTAASVPSGYALSSEKYTEGSYEIVYAGPATGLYAPTIDYDETYADYQAVIAAATKDTSAGVVRTVKSFSWNGRDGVVMGAFADAQSDTPISLALYYNDVDGRVLTITARNTTADALIGYLPTLQSAP